MTSKKICNYLWFNFFNNYDYKLSNAFIFGWESDFFGISKSGYSVEVEIKISKQDFYKDFEKRYRGIKKHKILIDNSFLFKPNRFYFAIPKGLIDYNDIPKEYGIIEINGNESNTIRFANFLHKEKLMNNIKFIKILLDKFYYRNIDLRRLLKLRDFDLNHNQKTIFKC